MTILLIFQIYPAKEIIMVMHKIIPLACLYVLTVPNVNADTNAQVEIENINQKYAAEWEGIREEGDKLKDEAPDGPETAFKIDFDCDMKPNEISLDIPEVTMKTRNLSLHVPQVTMKTNRISWDEPHTYTGTTVCGYYPEFRGLEVRMSEIKCDIPQVTMVRKEAKIDIPEFKWDRTEFKMDIPEFKMVTQRWKFDLPDCKIKDVEAETKKIKKKSKDLEERSTTIANRQKAEINQVVIADLTRKRNELDETFRSNITNISEVIDTVKSYGMDPTKVPQEDGNQINLVETMTELENKRKIEVGKLDDLINNLIS